MVFGIRILEMPAQWLYRGFSTTEGACVGVRVTAVNRVSGCMQGACISPQSRESHGKQTWNMKWTLGLRRGL